MYCRRTAKPTHVLITLFKAYCCSFYGSQLWKFNSVGIDKCCKSWNIAGLGSSTVDQVLKYTKYPKHLPSTHFLKSISVHQVLSYQVQVQVQVLILKLVLKSGWTYRAE